MEQRADGTWTDPVLHTDPSPLIGKQLVVVIRYPKDGAEALRHFVGQIVHISDRRGIVITRSDGRGEFAIPPRAFLVEEHQRATRPTSLNEVIYPDYSTLITLDGAPREYGWNPAVDRNNAQ